MLIGGFRSRLASRGKGTRRSRGRRDNAATGRQFRTTFVPLAAMIAPSALPEVKVGRVDGHGTGENRNHDSHQPEKKNLSFSGWRHNPPLFQSRTSAAAKDKGSRM
jgi:hypothetical protein